jgi:hypothetical protein
VFDNHSLRRHYPDQVIWVEGDQPSSQPVIPGSPFSYFHDITGNMFVKPNGYFTGKLQNRRLLKLGWISLYNEKTMKKINLTLFITVGILILSAAGCLRSQSATMITASLDQVLKNTVAAVNTLAAEITVAPTSPVPTSTPAAVPATQGAVGPDDFSGGVNPLTGLIEAEPDLLSLPPALISISNFPPSARKVQGGLGSAAQVYEAYIGEGMTRFLGVFYGSFPDPEALPADQDMSVERPTGIGPIRSGRTVYESIRARLNGFLVMASADKKVGAQLSETTNIFGSDSDDINSAMIDVSKLIDIAETTGKPVTSEMLSGNSFNFDIPAEGVPATRLWVFYNALDQALWEYQPDLGGYYRYQDNADESGEYTLMVDAFTGQPLLYENVIVLFAEHEFKRKTLITVNLDFIKQGKALLFRDGLMYKIYWTTRAGEFEKTTGLVRPIQYINYWYESFPLKPGQSWIHLVDINHRYWEADPDRPFKPKAGTAFWSVRFYDPTQNSN